MKRIITSVALMALAAPLSAMTPTELIQRMQNQLEIHSEHETYPQQRHRPYTERRQIAIHKSVPSKRIPNKRTKHHHSKSAEQAVAHKRTFHSLAEYRRKGRPVHRAHANTVNRHATKSLGHYVGNGWFVDDHGQYDEQYQQEDPYLWVPSKPIRRQHPYRHYRRQWYLTYLYEHAEFDDRYGYHYGYFDHSGFVFDGHFYAYDRAYTYQDRLHGKGLFEHRFYRPIHRYAYRNRTRKWHRNTAEADVQIRWRY